MSRIVTVTAPARLHFGMFEFGQDGGPPHGGVGVMVDSPETRLVIRPADHFETQGLCRPRVQAFAHCVAAAWRLGELPRCSIEVVSAPRGHIGLGHGTQLGLSVVAGLHALGISGIDFLGGTGIDAYELARAAGRGHRSAVGTYGFVYGGLVVDSGKKKQKTSTVSALAGRAELPADWRFVLFCPSNEEGLSGEQESKAFARLPPVPHETTERLTDLAMKRLLPAAQVGQFDEFSESLYEYSHLAGSCYAAETGGSYATPRAEQLVQLIREVGVRGVGQSSWGPTIFALLPDAQSATEFAEQIRGHAEYDSMEITVTAANRSGARIDLAISTDDDA